MLFVLIDMDIPRSYATLIRVALISFNRHKVLTTPKDENHEESELEAYYRAYRIEIVI